MFHLIFSVFYQINTNSYIEKIKIIISNGDPQEYSQIDNSIYKYLPFAKCGRYRWHIIVNSFEKHV